MKATWLGKASSPQNKLHPVRCRSYIKQTKFISAFQCKPFFRNDQTLGNARCVQYNYWDIVVNDLSLIFRDMYLYWIRNLETSSSFCRASKSIICLRLVWKRLNIQWAIDMYNQCKDIILQDNYLYYEKCFQYPNNLSAEILVIRIDAIVKAVPFNVRPVDSNAQQMLLCQCQPQLSMGISRFNNTPKTTRENIIQDKD